MCRQDMVDVAKRFMKNILYIICIFIFAYLIFAYLINFFWLNLKITKDGIYAYDL